MEEEFVDLINKYRALIFKVCNLYCDDRENRKDLFQEIVLQLWKSYPGFRKQSASSTWIYRVALNTAISNFRKDSKKPERAAITSTDFEIPDMKGCDDNEHSSMLHLAISKLTEIEKAIIMLYLDEKTMMKSAKLLAYQTAMLEPG